MISQVLAKLVTLVISKEDKKKVMRRKRSSSNVWQNQVIRVDILFWCDWVAAKDTSGAKRPPPAKREWHEKEVVDIFEEVKRKHEDFNTTKLRLWARMIMKVLMTYPTCQWFQAYHQIDQNGNQCMMQLWMQQRQSWKKSDQSPKASTCTLNADLSPLCLDDARMKHYEQLPYSQTFLDVGIRNDAKFSEQKSTILDALRSSYAL